MHVACAVRPAFLWGLPARADNLMQVAKSLRLLYVHDTQPAESLRGPSCLNRFQVSSH